MADDNYYRLFSEIRKLANFDEVFRGALDDVAGKVDFSHVKSCVAFGTSDGEKEMAFARRLLPNLRSFTAVERDPDSVKALLANFREGQLPGVETSVVETSMENWSGPDNKVDAVLFINVLSYVHAADRKALFRKLMSQYLSDGGKVVTCCPSGSRRPLLKRLGMPMFGYDDIENEMLTAGFRVVAEQDFQVHCDLSNPSDNVISFFRLVTGRSEAELRAAIDDTYSQPDMHDIEHKLAIFTK